MAFFKEPPPVLDWNYVRTLVPHKFKAGDIVTYFVVRDRPKVKSFCVQFRKVQILDTGYTECRHPCYKVKVLDSVVVKNGCIMGKSKGNSTTPLAYDIERNSFPIEEWDDLIQRKVNSTKAKFAIGGRINSVGNV